MGYSCHRSCQSGSPATAVRTRPWATLAQHCPAGALKNVPPALPPQLIYCLPVGKHRCRQPELPASSGGSRRPVTPPAYNTSPREQGWVLGPQGGRVPAFQLSAKEGSVSWGAGAAKLASRPRGEAATAAAVPFQALSLWVWSLSWSFSVKPLRRLSQPLPSCSERLRWAQCQSAGLLMHFTGVWEKGAPGPANATRLPPSTPTSGCWGQASRRCESGCQDPGLMGKRRAGT